MLSSQAGQVCQVCQGSKGVRVNFELVAPVPKRKNRKPEGAALIEVLRVLRAHPNVAWVHRMNSGAAQIKGRFVRFGFRGCSDLLGQLTNGQVLAVEIKSRTGRLREEQAVFIELVNAYGGCAFVARNAIDVFRAFKERNLND